MLNFFLLNVILLNVILLNVIHCVECHSVEFHSTKCHLLNFNMLNVIQLNVVVLNVMAPLKHPEDTRVLIAHWRKFDQNLKVKKKKMAPRNFVNVTFRRTNILSTGSFPSHHKLRLLRLPNCAGVTNASAAILREH
jgi:hypothetical protein